MEPNKRNDVKMEIIDKAIEMLKPHFDTVQIFCTKFNPQDGNTVRFHNGEGNWYARYGQVRKWLVVEDNSEQESLE